MDYTACPYDGRDLDAEDYSGGSVLLRCGWCGAAWEWHNAWIRRVAEPDRERVIEAAGPNSTGPGSNSNEPVTRP